MVKLPPFHGGDAGSTPAPGIVLLDDVKSHNQLSGGSNPVKSVNERMGNHEKSRTRSIGIDERAD